MPPPVVLHVAQPTEAGVARCVASYARHQRDLGWQVHVACPPEGRLGDDLREADISIVAWEAERSPAWSTGGEIRRLRTIIDRIDPHLVHLHSSKAGLAGRLATRGRRPTLFQPHGWSFAATSGILRSLSARWERVGARWADRVVCVSEQEKRDGTAVGVKARWVVVPNGVDVDAFSPSSAGQRVEARRRLDLPVDASVAVTVGRLVEAKGQRALVEAWRSVAARHPSALLVIVGDGPDRSRLEELAPPSIRFVGDQRDVSAYLAAADVFVQPSASEAMSLALLEAMAAGLGVVATDVGGAKEAVVEGAGAVVAVGDVDALGRAIAARLSDTALSTAEGGVARRTAEARFDGTRAAERIATLSLEVIGR